MNTPSAATSEQLANTLQALGVHFIIGGQGAPQALPQRPARLIVALAQNDEARLRLALIPLFLERPGLAGQVLAAAKRLDPAARLTLQCYYTAAVWLQQKYRPRLDVLLGKRHSLPDYFSRELGLENTPDPDENLRRLATRHQALSEAQVNWLGTYHHAARVWMKGMEVQAFE